MITKDDFKTVLTNMGFAECEQGVYTRAFNDTVTTSMKADFNKERLTYAQGIKINRETITDFSKPENFVEFECVCRLLDKGYPPQNIELEPSAGADGRGQTNTYLDILVKDYDGGNYLIIECKTTDGTSDSEFAKAWRKVKRDGGQLFNYHTLFNAPHLCLYASDLVDGANKLTANLIILKDPKGSDLADTGCAGYDSLDKTAVREDYFRIWTDTYEQAYLTTGVFDKNASAYGIKGKMVRTFDELEEIESDQSMKSMYNEFATIMRQHNVGSHENSFDKLVNLFLAKVVDEESNKQDLKFNWKTAAFDDRYSFQDRLQKLYTMGMKKFLGEEVTYINEESIYQAFERFRNDPDETRSKVLEYFREQKFYSNNDFAFLDVHNKDLFFKNMEVLIKVVEMIQNIRLKSDKENQFLGDLFEGFLDQGVKQSEGQYFTPLPIVKFIVSSLPIADMVRSCEEPPHVIDYACGAGHFLNEVAQQMRTYAEMYKKDTPLSEFYKNIVGVEKEYRLSKVAKVSAFMYNQDDIRIIYGDALVENKQMPDGTFHLLVANPPYSVKGFLETLPDDDRKRYSLFSKKLNLSKNDSIEVFFIERAKQLLAPGGICAIIMPSSVLNATAINEDCREIILKYFDLVGIAEFASNTFGQTPTNTVTLFMRRKSHVIDLAKHLRNRAEAWINGDFTKDEVFKDADALDGYCQHCGINAEEYRSWLGGGDVPKTQIFSEYVDVAKKKTRYGKILEKKITRRYTAEQKQRELDGFVSDFMHDTEKEKLYYYLLAVDVAQPVIIAKSPTDNNGRKAYLGYEWSKARGNEGIKYIGQNLGEDDGVLERNKGLKGIKTPLYDPNDYDNPEKINTLIKRNFLGFAPKEDASEYVSYIRLVDMIDFSRVKFDKELNTSFKAKANYTYKYEPAKLGKLVEIIRGVTYPKGQQVIDETKNVVLTADNITLDGCFEVSKKIFIADSVTFDDRKRLREGDCFMCFSSGSKQHVGKIAYINQDTNYYAGGFMGILRVKDSSINPIYLYNVMNSAFMRNAVISGSKGSNIQNLSSSIGDISIPLPPDEVQRLIVNECAAIDAEITANKKIIRKKREEIERILNEVKGESMQLSDVASFVSQRILYKEIDPLSYICTDNLLKDFGGMKEYEQIPKVNSLIEYQQGDILISNIRPYLKKIWYADKRGGCNPDVLVVRAESDEIMSKYLYYALRRQQFFDWVMSDVKGIKMPRGKKVVMERYKIAVPSFDIQQQIIEDIDSCEAETNRAKEVIESGAARRQDILDKYLK